MSGKDRVFCKIASREEVHEEEGMVAFHSIGGEATARVLVTPREHASSECASEAAWEVVELMGVAGPGYAFGINNGSDAGQEVFHLRAHVVRGRKLEMP